MQQKIKKVYQHSIEYRWLYDVTPFICLIGLIVNFFYLLEKMKLKNINFLDLILNINLNTNLNNPEFTLPNLALISIFGFIIIVTIQINKLYDYFKIHHFLKKHPKLVNYIYENINDIPQLYLLTLRKNPNIHNIEVNLDKMSKNQIFKELNCFHNHSIIHFQNRPFILEKPYKQENIQKLLKEINFMLEKNQNIELPQYQHDILSVDLLSQYRDTLQLLIKNHIKVV